MTPEQLLGHYDNATFWLDASGMNPDAAYQHALAVRALREARGEKPRGFKIGFTNRGIWPRYNVQGPIWGTVFDSTLAFCEGAGSVALAGITQPRIEPECVIGMASTPPPDASLDELFACVQWIAPGFEIVQSHMPGWKFSAGDTVADGGLHARLLVGRKVATKDLASSAREFEALLARARVVLRQNGERTDEGVGGNVLDGPLHALQHFLKALRACPNAPDLTPGDVVTTGTWTDAWPVAAGEQWSADFDAPLGSLEIRFS